MAGPVGKKVKFTPDQEDAIRARGGAVLVSAAAGSGKTAVLVERVIGRILDPVSPVDADRLLVATFSNAAANEMKTRIASRLAALLDENPQDFRLQRQLILVDHASISTIHSFCLELIRSNFQKLELPPDFRIADENELKILRSRAMEQVTEQFYLEDDGSFAALVELLSNHRNDAGLTDTVLKLYDFIRSHPFYDQWLDEKMSMYDPDQDLPQSLWAQSLFQYASDSLSFAARRIEAALSLMEGDAAMEKAYGDVYRDDLAAVRELEDIAGRQDWDGLRGALKGMSFGRLGSLRKYEDLRKKERVGELRSAAKETIADLQGCFCADLAGFREDIEDLRPKVEMLFSITRAFDREFSRIKGERRAVDFPDLEHFALRLLYDLDASGKPACPSRIAVELSERFEEILIDEYQDTNEAQDRIFAAVSRQQDNLFLVGDVKQSIYRFRQAMPEIFLEKKNVFSLYSREKPSYPAKIILGKNFRSRAEVTGSINYLFSHIMSEQVGEMEYGEEEALVPGAHYPACDGMGVEIVLLDASESGLDRVETEARYAARRIRDMLVTQVPVTQGGELRPVKAGDICILMRSPHGRAELYEKALADLGIAAWTDAQNGFLSAREVSSMVSILRAIDNPLLDIPLVGALLSPVFGFTAVDIARIRLCRKGPVYLALRQAADEGLPGAAGFLDFLARYRRLSAFHSADSLIRLIYGETDFLAAVQVMDNGDARRANLLLLADYAALYEKAGFQGLPGFLRLLDEAAQRGTDFAPAASLPENADAVKIMSIHKSKGLEFPIVFLADTWRQFNKTDLNNKALLHSKGGFACMRRDRENLRQFTTVPREALKLEMERSMLSEEMRVLYVALTRAKERVVITMAPDDPAKAVSAALEGGGETGRVDSYTVVNSRSFGEWILAGTCCHPSAQSLLSLLGLGHPPGDAGEGVFYFTLEKPVFPKGEESGNGRELPDASRADPDLVRELENRAAFQYPFERDVRSPSKLAVSEVSAGEDRTDFQKRPAFITNQSMTAAQKGSALHRFMQFCDYHLAAEDPQKELERLLSLRFLTPAEADAVDPEDIARFFASGTAKRIFSSPAVYRELRFLSVLGEDVVGKYRPDTGSSGTAVQGVADCVFLEEDQAVIVDFKTDYITSMQQLLDRYRVQIDLYRTILENSMKLPVKECILYSFRLGTAVSVTGQG